MGAKISQYVKMRLENENLEKLLSDKKLVDELRKLSSYLPDDTRKNLKRLSNKRPAGSTVDRPRKRSARVVQNTTRTVPDAAAAVANSTTLGAITTPSMTPGTASQMILYASPSEEIRRRRLWNIEEKDVALPLDDRLFETWKADPSAFLRNEGLRAPSSPLEYYNYALSLCNSDVIHKIQWRFIATIYYDIFSQLSQSRRISFTKEAIKAALAFILPLSSSNQAEEAKRNVTAWAREGQKYRTLAEEIGDTSCFFLLPSAIESTWKTLNLQKIKELGEMLCDLGIREKAQELGAVGLGESIETILKKPFECVAQLREHEQIFLLNSSQKAGNDARSVKTNACVTPPPRPPILPDANVFELLQNITAYFESMLSGNFETLLTPDSAKRCSDFDSYCFSATVLLGKGSPDKFRYAMYQATTLLDRILLDEHPRALACLLEVLIHFEQSGSHDLGQYLRRQIKDVSTNLLAKKHPWGQICLLLGELKSECLQRALSVAWRRTVDIFDRKIGPLEPLAVSSRLDFLKRVYGTTDHEEEERLLRNLLAQFKGDPRISTPRVMLNLAHNLNRQKRHDEAESIASEVRQLLGQHDMYASKVVENIESLKIISHARFAKDSLSAEETMRQAIQMIVDKRGSQDSWVFEFKSVLYGWFQSWGDEVKAKKLWEEIEEFARVNDISE